MDKVKNVLNNIEKILEKGLRLLIKGIKKVCKIKVKGVSVCLIAVALILVIFVFNLLGNMFKSDVVYYPVVYNSSDGDLILYGTKVKNEEDAVKLSNNDNTDNVKYANTSNRYVLFKKSDNLHLYDSKDKDSTIKIISDVYSYNFTENDKYVVALDKANNLYSYNLSKNKEANKLDKNVVAIVDYNDDYVLYISDSNLYIKSLKGNKKDERSKVSQDYSSNYVNQSVITEDGKKVLYIDNSGNLISHKISNNKEEKIASNVVSFNASKNGKKIYYESNDGKTSINYYDGRNHKIDEGIFRVYEADIDNEMVIYSKLVDGVYELYYAKGYKEAQLVQKNLDVIYSAMIFKDKCIYYVTKDNELRYSTISGSKVKKSKSVVDDVTVSSIKEYKDGLYLVADSDDQGGKLYKVNAYKGKKIDDGVNYTNLTVGRDGKTIYYFKDYNDRSGSFYKYSGKSKLIDTDVYSYSYVANNLIYYIKDYSNTNGSGDLYRFTNKSTKLASDVKRISGKSYVYENK